MARRRSCIWARSSSPSLRSSIDDAMKDAAFPIVVLLVPTDGLVLLFSPSTHASLVNRWNALLGIPARSRVESYRGVGGRLTGIVMIGLCAFVLFKTWHMA